MKGSESTYARTVLIIDDEPHIVRILKMKLENAGFYVITAVNGIDGLEKFVKMSPAVVITDINMPLVNGQEMYEMIGALRKNEPLLVIVMTSSVDNAIRRWAEERPNIHFIEKPFSPSNILKVINNFISSLHATQSNS